MSAELASARPARLLARGQHPHDVARHAARIAARSAVEPDTRIVMLEALRPHMGDARDPMGARWSLALHAWARSVRHVREPAAVGELLLLPRRVVEFRAGDCDDIALAVATFAAHVGLPAAIMSLWTGPSTAHHVAVVGSGWYGRAAHEAPSIVIDPELPATVSVLEPPYRFGRLFPVILDR